MADKPTETQKTTPKKGEPIEIPVPSKDQIVKDFEKIVTGRSPEDDSESDDEN